MPHRYFIFLVAVAALSLVCAMRTSFREQVLLHAMRRLHATSHYAPDETQLLHGALHGLFLPLHETFGDRNSFYIPPQERHEQELFLDNCLEGIGVMLDQDAETKTTRVVVPLFDGPAQHAGILAGDVIIRVDDTDIAGLSLDDITPLIHGAPGSTVTLTVQTGDDATRTCHIERALIQSPTVCGATRRADGSFNFTLNAINNIGYIAITCFTDATEGELVAALGELPQNITGLILDLRGNSGGSLPAAVAVADMFIEPNSQYCDIVAVRYRETIRRRYQSHTGVLCSLPMVVLIDGDSASAAEIVAAALQDYGRGTLVGERSFGKGTVQEISPLPLQQGLLYLTVAKYVRPSGANIHRDETAEATGVWGVTPDDVVPTTPSERQITSRLRLVATNTHTLNNTDNSLLENDTALSLAVKKLQP